MREDWSVNASVIFSIISFSLIDMVLLTSSRCSRREAIGVTAWATLLATTFSTLPLLLLAFACARSTNGDVVSEASPVAGGVPDD